MDKNFLDKKEMRGSFDEILKSEPSTPDVRRVGNVLNYHFKTIRSTHTHLLDYFKHYAEKIKDDVRSVVLTANEQTKGVGTKVHNTRRVWDDMNPDVNIKFSALTHISGLPVESLSIATGALVASELNKIFSICKSSTNVMVKWVNDLIIDEFKIGGVLCEKVSGEHDDLYLISIGLNVAKGSNLSNASYLMKYIDAQHDQKHISDMIYQKLFNIFSNGYPDSERIAKILDKVLAFRNKKLKFIYDRGNPLGYQVGFLKAVDLPTGCLILDSDETIRCETIQKLDV